MKKLLIFIPLLFLSCTTIKEVTTTTVEVRKDTVYVVNKAWEDSVAAFWENEAVTGTFLDSLSKDTVLVVKYFPGKEIFKVKKFVDTVEVVRIDTVSISTTNLIEEPTFLEQYWWLFLIIGIVAIGILFLIIIKR